MTNHALSPQLDPYFLNAEIVSLEKESNNLLSSYQQTSKIGLYNKQTNEVLTDFHQSLISLSETLDKVVGADYRQRCLTYISYRTFRATYR